MASLFNWAGHDPHLSPLPQGEERKCRGSSLIEVRALVIRAAEILDNFIDACGAKFIRKRQGNFRSRFFKGHQTRILDVGDLRNMEAEMGTKRLAGFPDA